MHSPIIYILQNEKGNMNENHHKLDEDLLPCEELMDDTLVESDWHMINTLDDPMWHRGECSLKDVMKEHLYFNVEENNHKLNFTVDKKNLMAWDDAINYLLERYINASKNKLFNNEYFKPNYDLEFEDYFSIQDKFGQAYGGVAFVLYKEYKGQLEIYGVFKEKDLIEYCKREMNMRDKDEMTFSVYQNVIGDYHY